MIVHAFATQDEATHVEVSTSDGPNDKWPITLTVTAEGCRLNLFMDTVTAGKALEHRLDHFCPGWRKKA